MNSTRPFKLGVLLLVLFGPAGLYGQAVDGHNGATIEGAIEKAPPDPKAPDLAAVAKLIVERTNAFRVQEGHPKLTVNDKLTQTARDFAGFMARTDKYGHEADGKKPAERVKEHGYDYCLVAENIAYLYTSAGFATEELGRRFVEGWQNSPGHRKNMLDPDVTETGVAVARGEKSGYYYAVQLFGRPKSQALTFKVANRTEEAIEYALGEEKFELPPRYVRTHERCRPEEVKFTWPDGAGEPAALKPAGGEVLVIVKEKGGFRVRQETSPPEKTNP